MGKEKEHLEQKNRADYNNKREFGISLTNSLKVINIDIGFSWV